MEIRDKRKLSSYQELKEALAMFKRTSVHTISNYVPNPSLHSGWANDGKTDIYYFDKGTFIVHDKGFMAETLFISSDTKCVMHCLTEIHKDVHKPVVLERVIRENKDEIIGLPDYVLRRMSRSGIFMAPREKPKRVEKASIEDIHLLSEILATYFNPLTERIPDDKELEELIAKEGISIIRMKEGIGGMIIYETDATNIHLRYWWVSPESRNMGLGSELLKDFFTKGLSCKRQFLWVFSDNKDAIAKYKHYGFTFDGIADEIYITQ